MCVFCSNFLENHLELFTSTVRWCFCGTCFTTKQPSRKQDKPPMSFIRVHTSRAFPSLQKLRVRKKAADDTASVRCEWHHQPAPSARRTFDLLIRFLVGGAACCKLSASFVLGCSFVAPFPNGTAVLWWDAKHHSKSPLFCPLCVSEATVSYHLEGPHPSVPLIFI